MSRSDESATNIAPVRRQHEIVVHARPERIWAIWTDVVRWGSWNAGIETIELHGEFETGTTFTMKPPGQDPLLSRLIDVQPPMRFTDETIVGETRVRVDHRCEPSSAHTTRVIYATNVDGPDAEAICRAVSSDFPDVLAALKKRAEQQAG